MTSESICGKDTKKLSRRWAEPLQGCNSISGFSISEIPPGKRKVTISTPLVHPVEIRNPRNQSITRLDQCPGQESNPKR